jgi:hypothetical protein
MRCGILEDGSSLSQPTQSRGADLATGGREARGDRPKRPWYMRIMFHMVER